MTRSDILLPGMGGQLPVPPPQLTVAAPVNDIQLVAVVAAQLLGAPVPYDNRYPDAREQQIADAVEMAYNIVGCALVKFKARRLDYYVAQHQQVQDQFDRERGIVNRDLDTRDA